MNQDRPAPAALGQDAAQESGPVRARVLCGGKYHVISLDARGRVVLHDHPPSDRRRMEAFSALGGHVRCLAVLHAWRRYVRREGCGALGDLSEALRPAARAREVHLKRADHARQGADPLGDVPLVQRPSVLARMINRLLGSLAPGHSCVVTKPPEQARLRVGSHFHGDYPILVRDGDCVVLNTWLDRRWYETVWKAGFAVVGGALTLRCSHGSLYQIFVREWFDGVELTKGSRVYWG